MLNRGRRTWFLHHFSVTQRQHFVRSGFVQFYRTVHQASRQKVIGLRVTNAKNILPDISKTISFYRLKFCLIFVNPENIAGRQFLLIVIKAIIINYSTCYL